jgi:hypothetical protein
MLWAALLALPLGTLGCGDETAGEIETDDGTEPAVELEQPFTSDVATLLDFAFDGELTSSSGWNAKGQIRAQLMFTVGQLNGEKSVARLDKLQLTSLSAVYIGNGLYRHRYHARVPVAWGSKVNLPSSYTFQLPRRVDQTGQSAFMTKYGSTCNDGDDGSVTLGNFWYHYRVKPSDCSLAPADIVTMHATVTVNSTNTVAKYPEYHKIWEDGALNIVAIFGKYANGATSQSDAGIASYNEFVDTFRRTYPDAVSVPASLPAYEVGPTIKEITFTFQRSGGEVNMTVFLIDSVTTVTSAWNTRYAELTPGADLILYNGHAGLGANIASLSRKGKFFPGKYQMFFMIGCDTFAY